MSSTLALPYLALFAVLFRGLLVVARVVPSSCRRCGLFRERRTLGEKICACSSQQAGAS